MAELTNLAKSKRVVCVCVCVRYKGTLSQKLTWPSPTEECVAGDLVTAPVEQEHLPADRHQGSWFESSVARVSCPTPQINTETA